MKYLLDVNALIALGHVAHGHYNCVNEWKKSIGSDTICLCSITELGFLRVSTQAGLEVDVAAAKVTLAAVKKSSGAEMLADDVGFEHLPTYVTKPANITDGHLLALAARHGVKLATLDKGIPGAHLIT